MLPSPDERCCAQAAAWPSDGSACWKIRHFAQPGTGNAERLAASAADGFRQQLEPVLALAVQEVCVRGLIKASGRCPRRNFGEEPRYVVISRNGVLEATHALGVKPGIFRSASMLLRTHSARRTGRMQTRAGQLWSGR
jgi:hypothetical protein